MSHTLETCDTSFNERSESSDLVMFTVVPLPKLKKYIFRQNTAIIVFVPVYHLMMSPKEFIFNRYTSILMNIHV